MLEDEVATANEHWIENLSSDAPCVFRGAAGKFSLEKHGYVGSVTQVNRQVAFDPFVKRAVSRGRLRVLTEAEAMERMEELVIQDEDGSSIESILESLDKGASERVGRYSVKNLPDEAEGKGTITSDQVWSKQSGAKPAPVVRQVDFEKPEPEKGPILDPTQVLTPTEYGE